MTKKLPMLTLLAFALAVILALPGSALAEAKISAAEYKAGDMVTIEGTIEPGKELYIAVAMQDEFKPEEATLPHEVKNFKKNAKKKNAKKSDEDEVY